MKVYIKEMPEACYACRHGQEEAEGYRCIHTGGMADINLMMTYKRRPKWCPLTTDPLWGLSDGQITSDKLGSGQGESDVGLE